MQRNILPSVRAHADKTVCQHLPVTCPFNKKVKFTPQPAMKVQKGGIELQLYSSFNLADRWVWVVNGTARPGDLPPAKRPGTGPTASLDGCRKSRPHRDSIPGPSSPQTVAMPTIIILTLTVFQCALISGSRHGVNENCTLLGIFAA
jgi:hypothetical protein